MSSVILPLNVEWTAVLPVCTMKILSSRQDIVYKIHQDNYPMIVVVVFFKKWNVKDVHVTKRFLFFWTWAWFWFFCLHKYWPKQKGLSRGFLCFCIKAQRKQCLWSYHSAEAAAAAFYQIASQYTVSDVRFTIDSRDYILHSNVITAMCIYVGNKFLLSIQNPCIYHLPLLVMQAEGRWEC